MSQTVTQSKSQRIKATKGHLQNVKARVDELRAMMELFNISTDLGEMYKSIKQTVIDPICHDIRTAETTTPTMFDGRGYRVSTEVKMGNPGSNKFCKQNVVTVSKCTRMLLKIAGILMPIFHSIGMNVWFRDLKAIKKPREQYKTLCKLFADAETKINSLPKTKINRSDRLAARINGLVKDYDPDLQFMLSGILHMKMTTGKSDNELVEFFLSDVRLPAQSQSGGGPDDDDGYGRAYNPDIEPDYSNSGRRFNYDDEYSRPVYGYGYAGPGPDRSPGRERSFRAHGQQYYRDDDGQYYQPSSPPVRTYEPHTPPLPSAPVPAPAPAPVIMAPVPPALRTRAERLEAHKSQQLKTTFERESAKRLAMTAEIQTLKNSVQKLWKELGMANPASKLSHVQKLKHVQNIAITQQAIFAKVGGYFEASKANMFIVIGTVGSSIALYMMGAMPAVMSAISQVATMGSDPQTIPLNMTEFASRTIVNETVTPANAPYGPAWDSYTDWKLWAIYGVTNVKSEVTGAASAVYNTIAGPTTMQMLDANRPIIGSIIGLLSVALIAEGVSARAIRGQEGRGRKITAETISIALDGFKHAEQGMGRCWDQSDAKNTNCPINEIYYPYDDKDKKRRCLAHVGCQWLDNSSALTILLSYIDELDATAHGYFDIEDLTEGQLSIIEENKKLRHTTDVFDIIFNQINQTMLTNQNLTVRITELNQHTERLTNLSTQAFTDVAFSDMMQNPLTVAGLNGIMAVADRRMQNETERSTQRKQLYAGLAGVGVAIATGGMTAPAAVAAVTSLGINHATIVADNDGIARRNEMRTIANIATSAAGIQQQLTMEQPNQELRKAYRDLGAASGTAAAAAVAKAAPFVGYTIEATADIVRSTPQHVRQTAISLADNARNVGIGLASAVSSRRAIGQTDGVTIEPNQEAMEAALEEAHERAAQMNLQRATEDLHREQQRKAQRDRTEALTKQHNAVKAQTDALQQERAKKQRQEKQRQEKQHQDAAAQGLLAMMNNPGLL
jgi:hypothetical protein